MLGQILINGVLLLGLLLTPARAQFDAPFLAEELLPAGVVNTALAEFGNTFMAGDYGLGNAIPVETIGQGERREVRIFRSPELRLYRKHASMQVLLGNIKGVFVWVETPPVQGHWHLNVDVLYQDGTRRTLFSRDLNRGVRDYVEVEPHTRLDCQIFSKTTAIKLDRKFILTISPSEFWARWPGSQPMPFRTYFE